MTRPQRLVVAGIELVDLRHFWPAIGPMSRVRHPADLLGVAVHHDGVLMPPGDRDYSGSTLDEDLERIDAIHRHSLTQGWGHFCYHLMASPNGRLFLTIDLSRYGAHVARLNHLLVGLSLMGDFTDHQPGDLQLCAAARGLVVVWALTGLLVGFRGHREWALAGDATTCPGETYWTWQHRLLVLASASARLSWRHLL